MFYVHSAGDKLIGRFERYWLGLDTGILKARAVRYLLVKHKEGGVRMTITPSPERRRQPMRTTRVSGPSAGIVREMIGRAGPSSDGDEWQPEDVIELTSSSEGDASDSDDMDL